MVAHHTFICRSDHVRSGLFLCLRGGLHNERSERNRTAPFPLRNRHSAAAERFHGRAHRESPPARLLGKRASLPHLRQGQRAVPAGVFRRPRCAGRIADGDRHRQNDFGVHGDSGNRAAAQSQRFHRRLINAEQAETVRKIYELYLSGQTLRNIKETLETGTSRIRQERQNGQPPICGRSSLMKNTAVTSCSKRPSFGTASASRSSEIPDSFPCI